MKPRGLLKGWRRRPEGRKLTRKSGKENYLKVTDRARDMAGNLPDTAGEGIVEERPRVPELRACFFVILDGNLSRLGTAPTEMRYGIGSYSGCRGHDLA